MAAAKYIERLPPEVVSPLPFFFQAQDIIEIQAKKYFVGYTITELRQLLTLQIISQQRRKLYIGLCTYYKLTPCNGLKSVSRRNLFNNNLSTLQAKGLIEIIDVFNGQQARLTPEGELLSKRVNDFLNSYYTGIFKQFNLVPVLPTF